MLTGRLVDSYTNIQTVKLFAGREFEDKYVASGIKEHTKEIQNLFRHFTYMWFALYVINGALMLVMGVLAIMLWQNGSITIGEVAMALPLTVQIRNMAAWVMEIANGVFENAGTVEEGMETISKPHTVTDVTNAADLNVRAGRIKFQNVSFDYTELSDGDEDHTLPVIREFNLEIEPGQKVGLVGRSGAGKSTLVNLLLRLYDIQSGQILIDGQDIAKVTQESLRRQIGMVTQDTSLLHRSIRDNLIYGSPEADEADMLRAAEQAEAHDFIKTLTDVKGHRGYDAMVGDRGVKLSGGQRQRIAIARVLLKDAPIMILDEATSALDSEVEAVIQQQLSNMMQNKTSSPLPTASPPSQRWIG
jgi:ATP-binding cassette subfamily B multidrug efflux pump